jgi:hypothetical protein
MGSPTSDMRRDSILWIALGAIAVAIILITASLLLYQGGDDETVYSLKVGDHLKYSGGGYVDNTTRNVTIWLNVTSIDATGCGLNSVIIFDDGEVVMPDPIHLNDSDPMIWLDIEGLDQGALDDSYVEEWTTDTAFGERKMNFVHLNNAGKNPLQYIYLGIDDRIIYNTDWYYDDSPYHVVLMETNISWV